MRAVGRDRARLSIARDIRMLYATARHQGNQHDGSIRLEFIFIAANWLFIGFFIFVYAVIMVAFLPRLNAEGEVADAP